MYAVRSVTPMLALASSTLNRCEHFRQCSSAGQIETGVQQLFGKPVVPVEQIAMEAGEFFPRHANLSERIC